MKRLILIILFLACLISGCGERNKELVIYLSILPSEEKAYRGLIERFEKETGIKTRFISQQYNQIRQAIESEIRAEKGIVDVFEVDVYYLGVLSGYAYDITDLASYFKKQNLYKEAFNAGEIDGKLLFVPHRIACQAAIYNSKYIKAPPATWQDFMKLANEFPKKIGIKASLYEGLVCDIFPIVWAMKGDIFNLNDENTKEALQFIKSLSGLVHPGSKTFKENTILEAQAREEIYLHFNWPFAVNYLKGKGLFPKPNNIAPMPEAEVIASVLGGGYLAISKAAPHKKEAKEFLKFIERRNSQVYLFENLGWIPTRGDVWLSMDDVTKMDFSAFAQSLQYVRSRPAVKNYDKISQIWQRIFYSLVFNGDSIDSVIERFSKELDEARQVI